MAQAKALKLNSFQLEASGKHFDRNLIILAPPGSGKTLTLIHRIFNLITRHQVNLGEILTLTFTNKAAEELRSRLERMISINIKEITICTFHSLGNYIVNSHYSKVGFSSVPKLLEGKPEIDFLSLTLLEFLKDNCISIQNEASKSPLGAFKNISRTIDPKSFAYDYKKEIKAILNIVPLTKGDKAYMKTQGPNYEKFIKYYNLKLKQAGLIDYIDMLRLSAKIFKNNPDIQEIDSSIKKYILVDEFQDTSKPQMRLLNEISKNNTKLTVCGDDDQTIYKFCGVSDRIFFDFQEKYSAKVLVLKENYRSTRSILEPCIKLINHNTNRYRKNIVTSNHQGNQVIYNEFIDDNAECNFVAEEIKKLHTNQGIPYLNIAVLCRVKTLLNRFMKGLAQNGIPTVSAKSKPLTKDENFLMSFIAFVLNKNNEDALKCVLSYKKFRISPKKRSLLAQGDMYNSLIKLSSTNPSFEKIIELIEDMEMVIDEITPTIFIRMLISKLKLDVNRLFYYGESIMSLGKEGLIEFMNIVDEIVREKRDFVDCSTIHSAKGKEWDVVFVIRVNELVLPVRSFNDGNIEEERKVAYVAMSRSKKYLYVSWVASEESWIGPRSRFVNEMMG